MLWKKRLFTAISKYSSRSAQVRQRCGCGRDKQDRLSYRWREKTLNSDSLRWYWCWKNVCVCVLVVVWVVASTKNKIYAFRKLNNIRIRLVILEYQPRSHTWANKLLYRPRSALFFTATSLPSLILDKGWLICVKTKSML